MGTVKKAKAKRQDDRVSEEIVNEFVDLVLLKGKMISDAYEMTHPNHRHKASTRFSVASSFMALPVVQARMQEVREEMRLRREEARERLIRYHLDDIDATVEREGSLTNCMEQVKSVSKILGLEQTKLSVEAKVGALDDGALQDKLAFLLGKGGK